MLRNHLIAVAIATVLGVGCLLPAQADTLADIKARGTIRIGTNVDFPPFGTLDANLQPTGSDIAAGQMLADDLGVQVERVQVTGPNRVPYLLTGNVDIVISAFTITPERKEVIAFSIPYSASESSVMAPKDMAIATVEDLAGKRLGVVRGNLQETLLAPLVPSDTQMVRFDDDAANIAALLSGQVDAIGGSTELLPSINQRAPDLGVERKVVITTLPHGIGVRKEDTALLEWINGWVKTNMENGRLKQSYEEAIGLPLPDLSAFTEQ